MSQKKKRWMRRLAVTALCLVIVMVIGGLSFKRFVTPVMRSEVERSLYTVGDANYEAALNNGKNIVKFGRLPFGLYAGGLAFSDPQEAWEYLQIIGKDQEWGVYRLSGDFELDTKLVEDQRYTTVSLVVLEGVEPSDAADEMLAMNYKSFDQTPESGWRTLAADGKYAEAASTIDAYLEANQDLPDSQTRILMFHAGQMYAYARKNETAKQRFLESFVDEEPEDSPIRWNAYVRATIAFLDQDRQELERCRDVIAAGPKLGEVIPNLDVVESLLNQLGEPYAKAYEAHRGMDGSRQTR